MVNFSLEGKVALVTGASYGIGFAIATGFAQAGAKIVFNPSPITDSISTYPLELVDIFILNEIEGNCLTGETDPKEIQKNFAEY